MNEQIRYDAIIIGAGPAGLAVGSELSKKHRILVIEKGTIGNQAKIKDWTTEKSFLTDTGLDNFISSLYKKCSIRSILGNQFFVKDNFVTVDGEKLLSHYERIIKSNKDKLIEYCEFESILENGAEGVLIETNKGIFRSRIVIDCSGYKSKIAPGTGLYEKVFYFPVYGGEYRIELKKNEPNLVASITKRYPMYYFDVFPVTERKCVFYTFQYLLSPKEPNLLAKMHSFHLRNSYLKDRIAKKKKIKHILGVIPMGLMKANAIDRISFFGDSALMPGAVTGSGFTNIVRHYKKYAEHISDCLDNNMVSGDKLDYKFSNLEITNRRIQFMLGSIIAKTRPEKYNQFVDFLGTLPNEIVVDLLFLRLTPKQYFVILERVYKFFGLTSMIKLARANPVASSIDNAVDFFHKLTKNELGDLFKSNQRKDI